MINAEVVVSSWRGQGRGGGVKNFRIGGEGYQIAGGGGGKFLGGQ